MILADRFNYPAKFFKKSQEVLETALATAPLYKSWQAYDLGPGAPLDQRYDALPELTKKEMRENFPLGLVTNNRNVEEALESGEIEYTFTSGSTGDRVINLFDIKWWYGAEAASWKLNAHTARLTYPQKEAKLVSALNFGIHCEEDLPMDHRILGRILYLNEKISILMWQRRHMQRMAQELQIYQPVILEANPSLLARLAFWAIDAGVELFSPAVIMFTYESPSKIHTAAIRKVFSSPLISSYGTTETGFVLQQCEAGHFHQNIDYTRIDFHPLKPEYGGPELGRILVTNFNNPWNAILRFDAGDLIRLHPSDTCECGRDVGFIADAIEGRIGNATFTTRGGLITSSVLDDAICAVGEIRDYHFEQHTPDRYELHVMLTDRSPKVLDNIREILVSLYGQDGTYGINVRDNLLPGPAGKFRRTQANFIFDQKGFFV